jgi:Tol biopolymer transport system component/DNA-binding winged helix-turn-helix (wHTH) protein
MHDPTVPPRHVNFGPFELDVRSGELRKGSTRLKVPDQSIEILKALIEQPGELVTREQLHERLWPANTFVDFEHGLNAAIRRLREALGDSADTPKYIETLPRRGYRFIGSVEGVPTFGAVPHAPVPIESPSAERRVEPPARTPVHIRRLTAGHLALLVPIVLTVGIGLYFIRRGSDLPVYDYSAARKSTPVTSLPGSEVRPSLSPDGNMVAFAWDGDSGDNFDIYVKQLDVGARPVPLTADAAEDQAPAWSPDGHRIAFVRRHGNDAVAIIVPAFGGAENPLAGITGLASGLSWTPDGKSLVFVGRDVSTASFAVFAYSQETGERRQLTQPTPAGIPDTAPGLLSVAPVISPDGRYLAYIGSRWNIVVQRLDDALRPVGAPKPLTEDGRGFSLVWAHDSSSLVYDIGGQWGDVPKGLWRVPIAGGQPLPVFPNVRASMPSVASNGKLLVYQNTTTDKNIWRMPGPERHQEAESGTVPERFIASNEFDMSPQISPDGRRVVFVSTRSGYYELWMSNTDTPATAKRLTKFEGAFVGSPRWSANGDFVAFDSLQPVDSNRSGSSNIWVVAADGTGVHPITNDSSDNARPSWSRDGRWIYFSSPRSGDLQIWKVLATGGTPVPVTKKGGAREAFESPDGKYLYYAKPAPLHGIWRVPVDGGDEVQVIDRGSPGWWAVIDGGIVLMNKLARPQAATVEYFSFDTARITWTRQLPAGRRFDINPGFSVSRDGQWMLFVQLDNWGSDLHVLQ